MIVKQGGKYSVKSEKTGRNLGSGLSKAGAVKRLQQVEYFKHAKPGYKKNKTMRTD